MILLPVIVLGFTMMCNPSGVGVEARTSAHSAVGVESMSMSISGPEGVDEGDSERLVPENDCSRQNSD